MVSNVPPDMNTFSIDVVVSMKSWYEPGRKSVIETIFEVS